MCQTLGLRRRLQVLVRDVEVAVPQVAGYRKVQVRGVESAAFLVASGPHVASDGPNDDNDDIE